MAAPHWQHLLEHPDRIDPAGLDLAVLADAGDPAYRAALDRWNALRGGDDRDAHAAIAMVLADAFDDRRALEGIAAEWPEAFPDQFVWRTFLAPATDPLRETFGPKVVDGLRTWARDALRATSDERDAAGGDAEDAAAPGPDVAEPPADAADAADATAPADLPADLARAARTLRWPEGGDVYLPLRPLLLARAGAERADEAERVADDLLVASAAANPDHDLTRRAVLSYWGQERPIDAVPTAEPAPGEAPASWHATCELIARTREARFADRVIEIAHTHTDAWQGPGFDGESYVRALERSAGTTADDHLLEIAKADVPASGLAVRALADRRRRLAGAEPAYAALVDAIIGGMRETGVLTGPVGPRTRLALAERRRDGEAPMAIAEEIAALHGRESGTSTVLEWSALDDWLQANELPGPTPVPAARPKRGGGLFGGLFGRG